MESLEARRVMTANLPIQVDFGITASPVAANYTQIRKADHFTGSNFGWVSTTAYGNDFSTYGLSDTRRDYVGGNAPGEFAAAVPNGTYYVSLVAGHAFLPVSDAAVTIENAATENYSTAGGSFHEFSRTVFVNDGVLTITFDDTGSSDDAWYVNELRIEEVNVAPDILNFTQTLTYHEGDAELHLLASTTTVVDEENDMRGGSLTVEYVGAKGGNDRLRLSTNANTGLLAITTTTDTSSSYTGTVSYNGQSFAAFSGGIGINSFVVTFYNSTTNNQPLQNEAVQSLLRAVTFKNVNNSNLINSTRNIQFTLTDGQATTIAQTLTLQTVNDAPTISVIPNKTLDYGEAFTPITLLLTDVEDVNAVTLSGTSSNTALVSNSNITFSGSGNSRTLNIIPTANQSGIATITITANDHGMPASEFFSRTFTLSVRGAVSNWQNPTTFGDVDGDGFVTFDDINAIDAVLGSGSSLPVLPGSTAPNDSFADVNGDWVVDDLDSQIINGILHPSTGSGTGLGHVWGSTTGGREYELSLSHNGLEVIEGEPLVLTFTLSPSFVATDSISFTVETFALGTSDSADASDMPMWVRTFGFTAEQPNTAIISLATTRDFDDNELPERFGIRITGTGYNHPAPGEMQWNIAEQMRTAFVGRIVPASPPTDISLSNSSVAENQVAGTLIGTLTAVDTTPGDTHTFALVSGTGDSDNASFTISGNQLHSAATFDFETKSSYSIRVRTTDASSLTYERQFTVAVTNNNEAPEITNHGGLPAFVDVAENVTAVTTITATDSDANTTLTFSKSGGADAVKFAVNSSTGVLTFLAAPNFEAPGDFLGINKYAVEIQVSDGSLVDTQLIVVTVINVNEAPTITSNGGGGTASINVSENTTALTTVIAADPDSNSTITYSKSGGVDAALFSINASTGVIAFVAGPNFEAPSDFDGDNIYEVEVQASDGSLVDTQAISVTVSDTNESPILVNIAHDPAPLTVATLPLSGKEGDQVFDALASDPDLPVQTLTYSLSVYPSDGLFSINPQNGVISLTSDIPLDTAKPTYYLTVSVDDSGTPSLGDVATFELNLVTAVGILGDTQAIEGGTDNIVLKARRYAFDNSTPLLVYYELDFSPPASVWYGNIITGAVTAADIDSGDLSAFLNDAGGTRGVVEILANETVADLPVLRAVSDDYMEGGDTFAFENLLLRVILDPVDPNSYAVAKTSPDDPKKAYMDAIGVQELIILDGVQLFSKSNAIAELDDEASSNPQLDENNPGIHPNDIRQGGVGDCWFMAAVLQLARFDYTKIEQLFRESANGFEVRLYEEDEWVWQEYELSELLTRGQNGAILSGDRDFSGAEIWPQLLERRLADYHPVISNGDPLEAWKMLTGEEGVFISAASKTGIQILDGVRDAVNNGKLVLLSTKDVFAGNDPNKMTVNGNAKDNTIIHNHCYVVRDLTVSGINLLNPWGEQHVFPLPSSLCDDTVEGWYELAVPTSNGPQ